MCTLAHSSLGDGAISQERERERESGAVKGRTDKENGRMER